MFQIKTIAEYTPFEFIIECCANNAINRDKKF